MYVVTVRNLPSLTCAGSCGREHWTMFLKVASSNPSLHLLFLKNQFGPVHIVEISNLIKILTVRRLENSYWKASEKPLWLKSQIKFLSELFSELFNYLFSEPADTKYILERQVLIQKLPATLYQRRERSFGKRWGQTWVILRPLYSLDQLLKLIQDTVTRGAAVAQL